ncbi:MAG: Gfo/Idh/MocA family oxidoreductase [Candidatus Hydrogenedentes bacterium]|nr:Gfo/Idh/MocA family oxidoreductase [Candidatus Hydrogenedentota bacterium]
MRTDTVSRRDFFIRGAGIGAAAAVAPLILPACLHAKPGRPGPNDRVNVGYIGVGRRGRQVMGLPDGAQIVAISDVNQARMADLIEAHPDWRAYQDYRELLACDDIDAVVVATPDHWHVLNAVHACEAGKDVYIEKPMSLTVREGRALVRAARKHQRVVQTGSQQRSMDACRLGCELVQNGRLGAVHTVHGANYPSPWECDLPGQPVPEGLNWDMWCGPTELRPYHEELYLPRVRGDEAGWISFRPYSGGEMTGWGAHGLDLIQWALGADESGPVEVWPEPGTEPANDTVHKGPRCQVGFRYASGVVVKLDNHGPAGGGVFEGDAGQLLLDRGKCVTKPEGIAKEPLADSDIHLARSTNHLQNWVDCIRTGEKPIADVEIGHRSATMCHLGNIARWTGRSLGWDPERECFIGDDEANALLERPMRKPWAL